MEHLREEKRRKETRKREDKNVEGMPQPPL
jgi:hypothetical protein